MKMHFLHPDYMQYTTLNNPYYCAAVRTPRNQHKLSENSIELPSLLQRKYCGRKICAGTRPYWCIFVNRLWPSQATPVAGLESQIFVISHKATIAGSVAIGHGIVWLFGPLQRKALFDPIYAPRTLLQSYNELSV